MITIFDDFSWLLITSKVKATFSDAIQLTFFAY